MPRFKWILSGIGKMQNNEVDFQVNFGYGLIHLSFLLSTAFSFAHFN